MYFGLVAAISYGVVEIGRLDYAPPQGLIPLNLYGILAIFLRLVVGSFYIHLTKRRLHALSKSRLWLILLAIPIVSPIFSLVIMFWKEELPSNRESAV